MVHSDIKPANILIKGLEFDNVGNYSNIDIAVADFGLTLNSYSTKIRGGTKHFCAPELWDHSKQCLKGKPTFYSDLYALGKTFKKLTWEDEGELADFLHKTLNALLSDNPEDRNVLEDITTRAIGICRIFEIWEKEGCLVKYFKTKQAVRFEKLPLTQTNKLFRKDREIVLTSVKNNGNELQNTDESFREVVLTAVRQAGVALEYADESLKKDREIVLESVKNDGLAIQYADESFRQNGLALGYADESFRKDREIVLIAVKQKIRLAECGNEYKAPLQYADESLKKDREIVLEAVKQMEKHFYMQTNPSERIEKLCVKQLRHMGVHLNLQIHYSEKTEKSY